MLPAAALTERKARVEEALARILPLPGGRQRRLAEAMRYAVFGGGKRLRPLLAIAAFDALEGSGRAIDEPAAALELIHTYSLVHDDLPAMDDDALLTLAFEVLSTFPNGDAAASRRAGAVAVVARGAGAAGMVGGQMADLEGEQSPPEREALTWIHAHKTGALLAASAELGALHAGADAAACAAMARYGASLGLAFQIIDDVLDRTESAASLGKTPGKDEAAGKVTFPALIGIDASRREAERLVEEARAAIPATVRDRTLLDDLARYSVERSR